MSEASDIRGVLLAALQMGEWEAEHLTGLQLARRLAAIHLATAGRLQALGCELQAAKVERDALASGEELSRLAEQLAALEAENARLRAALEALARHAPDVVVPDGDTLCTTGQLARRALSGVAVTDDDGEA